MPQTSKAKLLRQNQQDSATEIGSGSQAAHLNSPYRNVVDSAYNAKIHNRVRWKKITDFLPSLEKVGKGLDVGDRSAFTDTLESFYNCRFDNTTGDLDTVLLTGDYDIITCFEVIEHLYNPLHCLMQIKSVLQHDGLLLLSTPLFKPHLLWSKNHFHEMSYQSLTSLLRRANLKIVRQRKITTLPWWRYFTGFRPLLRGLLGRTILLEIQVAST